MTRSTWKPQADENIEIIIHILRKDGTREYALTGNRIIIPLQAAGISKDERVMLPFWLYEAIKTYIQRNESLRRLVHGEGCPAGLAAPDGSAADISRTPFLPTLCDCIEIQELPHNGPPSDQDER